MCKKVKQSLMNKTIFGLGVAGFLFSGYMSVSTMLTGTCAFNESCPNFFGYPACYFGFLLFLLIMLYAGLLLWGKEDPRAPLHAVVAVSSLGILFSGYFTLAELPILLEQGFGAYVLGLPTCALGFILYVAVVLVALRTKKQQ